MPPSVPLLPAPAPPGPTPTIVPDRRDHSVNGAWVDGWQYAAGVAGPVFRTQTNVNPAGGYTGGGTGNKAILGHFLPPAGMPLGSLTSIEYTAEKLAPEVVGINIIPYINLIVELVPGIIVVMVLGDFGNVVPTGTFSSPGPNQFKCVWTPGANLVLVVNFEGMATPAAGPWAPVFVVPSFGPAPSTPPSPGNWPGTGYKIGGGGPTDILTAYPGAKILNVDPLDGGLPKTTIISGIIMNIGSSSNFIQNAIRLLDWKVNGVAV